MYKEAKEQALKDIRAELKKENRTFISVSLRQLKALRNRSIEDVYCRAGW